MYNWFNLLTATVIAGSFSMGTPPALSASWDSFEDNCTPQAQNTHRCLESRPTYSYHLVLPSHYHHPLCLSLGEWDGKNNVLVEWDYLQLRYTILGQPQQQQMIQPELREGLSSGVIVYSQRPILPSLIQGLCPQNQTTNVVVLPGTWSEGPGSNLDDR